MRFDDPESVIIAGIGLALLVVTILGPLLFNLPAWSRMGALLGIAFLVYGVVGLRKRPDDRED